MSASGKVSSGLLAAFANKLGSTPTVFTDTLFLNGSYYTMNKFFSLFIRLERVNVISKTKVRFPGKKLT